VNPNDLLKQAQDLKAQYNAGKLSPAEFKELVGDLNIAGVILKDADSFEQAQEAREILLDIAAIAQAAY
jgi:hypothetical protein